MLSMLPDLVRDLLLICLGAATGAAINWAIYRLALFRRMAVSPWQRGTPYDPRPTDRIPLWGWWQLRRFQSELGRGFWIRPLLMEGVWAAGLPLFWRWQLGGGLTGGATPEPLWPGAFEVWFWVHSVLLALLFVATFIDFDEKTIPDGVTVTGALFALSIAALVPGSRLPLASLAGIRPLHFNSPAAELPDWHASTTGLGMGLAIVAIWIAALIPKLIPIEGPLWQRWRFIWASIRRPPRRTPCPLGNRARGPRSFTWFLLALAAVLAAAVTLVWAQFPPENWTSLLGALLGLGFGGGLVWGIRIIAGMALGQEAMGFGDVTLMAMIGAFLGWQPALIAFALAPFAGVVIAIANFVFRQESELAFGPYLCLGAAVTLFGWHAIWPIAAQNLFAFGGLYLLAILAVAGGAMFPLLWIVRSVKLAVVPEEEEA